MTDALIYARISQDRIGAGLGVDRQTQDCLKLAQALGWTVVGTHTDNDTSAYSGRARPGYRALLADLENDRATAVLAWHTDRLHRNPRELEEYVELCERKGIVTHTVQAGEIDLATASGRAVARTLGAWARFESEHKADRVRRARQQAATQGRWSGGVRPFGFAADGETIDPAEAAEIKRATDALLSGSSLRSITRDLNDRGVRGTKGKPWSPESLRDVLLRPRNAGLAIYRGEVVGPAGWPPIVSEDAWRAVTALLTDPGRRTTPGGQPKWLGTNIYRCGETGCGETVFCSRGGGSSLPSYRCKTRRHVSRNAEHVDRLVAATVLARLAKPDAAELLDTDGGPDTAALHAEATAIRARLEDIAREYAAGGTVTLRQLTVATAAMEDRLAAVEGEIAAAAVVDPLAELVGAPDIAERWEAFDLGRKRRIVSTLVTVTILPSRGGRGPDGSYFNPKSVDIRWNKRPKAVRIVPREGME